jgi:hypothetical protein
MAVGSKPEKSLNFVQINTLRWLKFVLWHLEAMEIAIT